jgi:hypothetical protein
MECSVMSYASLSRLRLQARRSSHATIIGLFVMLAAPACLAQLNWDGQTGGLLTPFAYVSDSPGNGLSQPELAFHYMNAGPALGNEFQASVTFGFLKIGEIGYTRSFNAEGSVPGLSPLFANGFNIGHIKFKLVPENFRGTKFIPAIAAAAVVRTQVRRITEVDEAENTTATDFDVIATKTIDELPAPVLLNFGVKLTNASLLGLAANSPNWDFEAFGAAGVQLRGPKHSKLLLGAEFLQEPRHFKEVPGQFFSVTAVVPTTVSYFVRVRPGSELPFDIDLGLVQLGGTLGSGWNIQARHQFTMGVSYQF